VTKTTRNHAPREVRRGLFLGLTTAAILVAFTTPAYANTGTVTASADCETFDVTVVLAHNVTPDRTVDVVTTIPGTTGISQGHFTEAVGEIWHASGPAFVNGVPATGTVRLDIYKPNGDLEDSSYASIQPPEGCVTATSTTAASTSTTVTSAAIPSSTTTTVAATGTIEGAPPTAHTVTAAPTPTALVEAAAESAPGLPRTGGSTLPLGVAGVVVAAGGGVLLTVARRKDGQS
jgi:LPXTG-motif cell wall-anchored protein